MLGESHDILHEFPEYEGKIKDLVSTDTGFAGMLKDHDQVDAQIRELELHDQPVADEFMENLKKQRAMLKDQLYERLRED